MKLNHLYNKDEGFIKSATLLKQGITYLECYLKTYVLNYFLLTFLLISNLNILIMRQSNYYFFAYFKLPRNTTCMHHKVIIKQILLELYYTNRQSKHI